MPITHSVFFNLNHEPGSEDEKEFFRKSLEILKPIPGVQAFSVLSQTSPKADFKFGFSMIFESQSEYDVYNNHPDHVSYVSSIWENEVREFQEIDHIPHPEFS